MDWKVGTYTTMIVTIVTLYLIEINTLYHLEMSVAAA